MCWVSEYVILSHTISCICGIGFLWVMVQRSYNCCDCSCEYGLRKRAYHSFSMCPPFLCKGNVKHCIYGELDAADCAQLVLKEGLEIVL